MVVGFTTIYAINATQIVNSIPTHGEVYLTQHYVIKFVSDLWQFCGSLLALQFPQRYNWNIVESGVKQHNLYPNLGAHIYIYLKNS